MATGHMYQFNDMYPTKTRTIKVCDLLPDFLRVWGEGPGCGGGSLTHVPYHIQNTLKNKVEEMHYGKNWDVALFSGSMAYTVNLWHQVNQEWKYQEKQDLYARLCLYILILLPILCCCCCRFVKDIDFSLAMPEVILLTRMLW